VEAALVLPFIVLVILATTEACNRIFLKQSLAIMAYEGARVALIPDSTFEDIEMQVEDIGEIRGLDNTTVEVFPSDFNSKPSGTIIEIKVTAVGNQASMLNLFPSSSSSRSVFMMKEF